MSGQTQPPQGFGAVPSNLLHFWDPTTPAYSKITILYQKWGDYRHEDVVRHAWGEICDLYFPRIAAVPNGARWVIDREAYRGYPPQNPSQVKPALIASKLTPAARPAGQILGTDSRDYLWIECKAANEDNPSGWRNVLQEAVSRLATAHSQRELFLIIAVGWKFAFFMWDPIGRLKPQKQIFIRPAKRSAPWTIDPRIKVMLPCPWVSSDSGEFDTERVFELDCWTTSVSQGQTVLRNLSSLGLLEQFLTVIQNVALLGLNPPVF